MSNFTDSLIETGDYDYAEQEFTLATYPTVEAAHDAAIEYAAELKTRGVEGWDLKTLFLVPGDRSTENLAGYRLEWAEPTAEREAAERDAEAIAAGERRYAASVLGDDAPTCRDCGEYGERTGHMGCQYPQDRE